MPICRAALDDERNVSTAVVEAVAEAKGVSPTDVGPPLHRFIDADALNALFRFESRSAAGDPRVSFRYAGYEITVREGDEVVVREFSDAEGERVE